MIRKKTIGVITVFLFIFCSGYIFAQTQKPSPHGGEAAQKDPRMEQAIEMMFREMDTNHDGKISKSEWLAFQEKQFNTLDKDGNGFITKDEVRAEMQEEKDRMQKGGTTK